MHFTFHMQDYSLQFVKYLAGYIYSTIENAELLFHALLYVRHLLQFCGGVYLHNPSRHLVSAVFL